MMNEEYQVWMNGDFVLAREVTLSVFNLGVSVGLGVFETLIAYRGVMPNYDRHLERLEASADRMDFDLPTREKIADVISVLLQKNHLGNSERARVRITLGAGEQGLSGSGISPAVKGYLVISVVPQQSPEPYAQLAMVPMRCNEYGALAGVKTTSYAENIMAYRHAVKLGADEAIMLNTREQLCECAMANIFLVKEGEILTPHLDSGCLPGVTRSIVIDLCQRNGLRVRELTLSEEELRVADEIFITSSAREIQPARILGDSMSEPGELTQGIAAAYREYLIS